MLKRGNIPRRRTKVTPAQIAESKRKREDEIIKEAARLRAQFKLEDVEDLPDAVKAAIEKVTQMEFRELLTAVRAELGK